MPTAVAIVSGTIVRLRSELVHCPVGAGAGEAAHGNSVSEQQCGNGQGGHLSFGGAEEPG